MILEPGVDLSGRKILCVGVSDRKIEAVHLIINVAGDRDPAYIPITPRPTRATVSRKTSILDFRVNRDDADAPQIRQLARDAPWPSIRNSGIP